MIEDVIPFVEKTFRTLPGADNRALGGLSMGGGQTAAIGFSHPELFRSLVIMSAGSNNADTTYPDFFKDPAATNKQIKLLWMGVGKDDTLVGPSAKALDATADRERHQTHVRRSARVATSGSSGDII